MAAYTVVRYERDQESGELVVAERKRFETDQWFEALRRAMAAGDEWHVALTRKVSFEHLCTIGLPKEPHA